MRHTWKNAARFEKRATLLKMRDTRKKAAHLEKCVTV